MDIMMVSLMAMPHFDLSSVLWVLKANRRVPLLQRVGHAAGEMRWCPCCQQRHQYCCHLLAHPLNGGRIVAVVIQVQVDVCMCAHTHTHIQYTNKAQI